MEYGFKDIKCYVQKHKAPQAICYNPRLIPEKPLGAYCETPLLHPTDIVGCNYLSLPLIPASDTIFLI